MTFVFSSNVRGGADGVGTVFPLARSFTFYIRIILYVYYRLRGITRGISHEARCLGTGGGDKVAFVLNHTAPSLTLSPGCHAGHSQYAYWSTSPLG